MIKKVYKKITRKLSCILFGSSDQNNTATQQEYVPKEYWKERHDKFGTDIRGVGVCGMSQEENEEMYRQAQKLFMDYCSDQGVDFKNSRILEIGCGTGAYTRCINQAGGMDYLGVDITDSPFARLKEEFPDFNFRKMDITADPLDGIYDIAVMIDVTQHIVDNDAFSRAMENIRSHLTDGGVFIVTAWLTDEFIKRAKHEVARPMSYYKSAFPDSEFGEPIPFRWKYLFLIRK